MRSSSEVRTHSRRFRRSRALLPVAAITLGLVLAGCSSDDDGDGAANGSDNAGGDTVELSLVKDGTLTVCSDIPYIPFEFEEGGSVTGFDYDVVAAMAERMGLDGAQFDTTPFDGIIPALEAKNCDMIASAMTITEERAEKVDFSDPYFDADQSLLVLKENADKYASLEDLANETIGVQSGTTGKDYTEEHQPEGSTIKEFQTGDELFPAMIAGEVQAALQDLPVNGYRAATAPDQFVVTETFTTGEQYGFAVRQNEKDLLDALNKALADIKSDGTYDEIFKTWFGGDN